MAKSNRLTQEEANALEAAIEGLLGAAFAALKTHPLHVELQNTITQHTQGIDDSANVVMVYIQGYEAIKAGVIARDRQNLVAWVSSVGARSPALLGNVVAVQLVAVTEHAVVTMTRWLRGRCTEFDTRCREFEEATERDIALMVKPSGRAAWLRHLESLYGLGVAAPLEVSLRDLCKHRAGAAHKAPADDQVAMGEHVKIWMLACQTLVRNIAVSAQRMLQDEPSPARPPTAELQ